jgi:hypothetical protein
MDHPKYHFKRTDELHFDFESIGKKGLVLKRVTFIEFEFGFFNMGLGDVDEATGEVNYHSITDNGDRDKVLATVTQIIEDIFISYPEHTIFFKGTTASRTRLYQIAINHYLDELTAKFHILGELEDKMTRFTVNTNYKSFLILKK